MSYILDALNKAERERKLGQVPSLESSEANLPLGVRKNPWRWVAFLAVVINATLVVLLIYSTRTPDDKGALPVAEPAPDPSSEIAALPLPVPVPVPPVVEVLPKKMEPPASISAPILTDKELQRRAARIDLTAPVPEVDADGNAVELGEPEPPPVLPDNTPLAKIPLLVEKSPQFQQALPTLRVDVHVYADEPENRFVMLSLKKYHEGDEIVSDLYLERITKEGMVLVFRNERFRYLIGG